MVYSIRINGGWCIILKYQLKVYHYNGIFANEIQLCKDMYFEEYEAALSYGQSELLYAKTAGFIITRATDNETLICVERRDIIVI